MKKPSLTHFVCPVSMASFSAQLGDLEQTLALLEQGYQLHSPQLLWIQNDPTFDSLHSDSDQPNASMERVRDH